MENRKVVLNKRPQGLPESSTWNTITEQITAPDDGEILVKNEYISIDPAMRGWLEFGTTYIEQIQVGDVMNAGTVGVVVESNNHPDFAEGDIVTGWGNVQTYYKTKGKGCYKVDTTIAPMQKYLGILGNPGMTAYFGILDVGKIKSGDIVLISGAEGAVGSVAGQIAKAKGCTVIGIAGGQKKCDYVTNVLGFDACIDYKNDDVDTALRSAAPKGIDVYFDNVGGDILDIALSQIRRNARIVICGAISQVNNLKDIQGPQNYFSLIGNSANMQGFVVFDYVSRFAMAAQEIAKLIESGQIKSEETIVNGIENFNDAFLKLFSGDKRGKLLLKI